MAAELAFLVIATVGALYLTFGLCHVLLWAWWRLGLPLPAWALEHLNDEWGQHR